MFNQNYLKPGDLLQVISPSGCLRELDALKRGIQIWRSHGYQVELTPNYDEQWGYLAGTDESAVVNWWQLLIMKIVVVFSALGVVMALLVY